jgi:NADPH:quinone reductase-like Zn-dependent oxidoreductase
MKAIGYQKYGSAEVLEMLELPIPKPQKDEVLIYVSYISLNPRDVSIRSGNFSLITGKKFPKLTGADFSGTIVQIGDNVTNLKIGDMVFGYVEGLKSGISSEYTVVPKNKVAIKPDALTHQQAATLGCAYLTALQALKDKAHIKKGDKVLIYGASGGVGSAAIQLAKHFGATVTAISNSSNKNNSVLND